jgi:hypothetical protein
MPAFQTVHDLLPKILYPLPNMVSLQKTDTHYIQYTYIVGKYKIYLYKL